MPTTNQPSETQKSVRLPLPAPQLPAPWPRLPIRIHSPLPTRHGLPDGASAPKPVDFGLPLPVQL